MPDTANKTNPPEHKMPGWLGALVVILAIGGGGWFAWNQFAGGARVGERIELAPEPQARVNARNLGQDVQRALQNLGRNRGRAATRPTTAPARR